MTISVLAAFAMIAPALKANAAGVDPFVFYVAASVSCAALPGVLLMVGYTWAGLFLLLAA